MLASEDLTISFCSLLRALSVSTQPLSKVIRKRRIRAPSPKPMVGVSSLVMKREIGLEPSDTKPYLTSQAANCLLRSAPVGGAGVVGGVVGGVAVAPVPSGAVGGATGALGCFWRRLLE